MNLFSDEKKIEKVYCGIPKLPPIFPRATFDNTLTGGDERVEEYTVILINLK